MSKENMKRGGCVDVFHSFLLQKAKYSGEYDFPVIKENLTVPRRMIPFSKALQEKSDYNQWVCFYEDDFLFERIWKNPSKYVDQLRKFEGVITPDFSVHYDMPLSMQLWNIFRSRTIGMWLQQGLSVIPNIRFGDKRTFECSCDGVSKHSVISIGSLGCIKVKSYRAVFEEGVEYVAERLKPESIVFYGSAPGNIEKLKHNGINIVVIRPLSFYGKEVKG